MTGTTAAGGLIGRIANPTSSYILENLSNTGDVTAPEAGGILGRLVLAETKAAISMGGILQAGAVTGSSMAGGVIGSITGGSKTYSLNLSTAILAGTVSCDEGGQKGLLTGGSTGGADGTFTATADSACRFASTTGAAYYDLSNTAQTLSDLEALPENSLMNKTVLRLLNAYAESKDGLLSWKQAADWPDLFLEEVASKVTVLILR